MGSGTLSAMSTVEFLVPRLLPGIWHILEITTIFGVLIQTLIIPCLRNYESSLTDHLEINLIFLKSIFCTGLLSIMQI